MIEHSVVDKLPTLKVSQLRLGQTLGTTAIDLCSGLGGFTVAVRWMGLRPILACDNWEAAKLVFRENNPDVPFIQGNIMKKSVLHQIIRTTRNAGGCDVLCFGPPCQGFSQIRNGHHAVYDRRNEVIKSATSIIAGVAPRSFIIENVPGLMAYRNGKFIARLVESLGRPSQRLRYDVEAAVFDAATFGVPQQRRRTLIIGVQPQEGTITTWRPEPLGWYFIARRRGLDVKRDTRDIDRILRDPWDGRLVRVRDAINDLPPLPAGRSEILRPYRTMPLGTYQRMMRDGRRLVSATATPRIKDATRRRLGAIPPGGYLGDLPARLRHGVRRRHYSAYRRLHPDLPATTLSTKPDCAYHHTALRALSVREYARLQSIPDHYEFPVFPRHAYALIGNAVPPLMIARLMKLSVRLD